MSELELRGGAGVFTPGGEQVGTVNAFVLDPASNEVTHIVVQKGWLLSEDRVLPFSMVDSATEEKVVLNREVDNFAEFPAFEETHFIRPRGTDVNRGGNPRRDAGQPLEGTSLDEGLEADVSEGEPRTTLAPAYYWYPPHGYLGYPAGDYGLPPVQTVRNIPEDTIPLKEGTNVIGSDGKHIGDVERLFVDPESNKATHFVISQGVFFKDRKLVPTHWVRSVEEDQVHLAVASELLEELPPYEE
jgi:uncharacterized protein YrrD